MPANVQSTDAILAVRAALVGFAARVSDAMTELEAEMRRMQEWLEHDRPRFWRNQVRLAVDAEHEAQQALHRCLMFPVANERPSCYEERQVLKKAQARLRYCEEKVDRVRHWQREVQHELFEYQGRMTQLVRLVEIEVPQAIAVLDRIVRHVEEYQQLRARDPAAAYSDMSVAREVWPEGDASATAAEAASPATDVELPQNHPHPGPLPEGEGGTEESDASM